MAEWIETYRGVVNAWECDIVEHFTIAYYFERFADATRTFLELIGDSETLGPAVGTGGSRLYTTFTQELRAGAGFHILSAVVALDEHSLQIGHQVVASGSEQTVSWVMETLPLPVSATPQLRRRLEAHASAWPGPEVPQATAHGTTQGELTARDRVKPWELGEGGTMSLAAQVHRFSAAGMQFLSSIGMTAEYMNQHRRGFSTLALDLRLVADAKVGDRIDVRTSMAHLGNYLAQLSSPHEPWRRPRDRVSRAGRCASRPRCPAPDSDAVGNKAIDFQAVAESIDVFRTREKTWPIPMAR